jgi:biopolymer transport protein ExbD
MRFQPRRQEDPEINLTSLIDVVLLLVIFFMVSTSFTVDGRLQLRLPQATAAPERRLADSIVITVTVDGEYRVNDRVLANSSPATLREALTRTAAAVGGTRGRQVTVRADARATHQSVITAMDVAGKLGFTQVNIATMPDETLAAPDGAR